MTLSSILNDGSAMNISYDSSLIGNHSFAWSDMPVVGDYCQHSQLEFNQDFLEKDCEDEIAFMMYHRNDMVDEVSSPRQARQRKRGHHKSVSFGQYLEVREHALTIGDHPFCRDSLPLSLAWEHGETERMDLECYEAQRLPRRRSGNDMKLSYYERKNLLRNIAGMTEADLRSHFQMQYSLTPSRSSSDFGGLSQLSW
jgi:hypothetical protein